MMINMKIRLLLIFVAISLVSFVSTQQQQSDELVVDSEQMPLRIVGQPQSQIALKGSRVTFKCDYEVASSLDAQQIEASIKVKWLFNLKQLIVSRKSVDDDEVDLMSQNFVLNTNQQYSMDKNRLTIAAYDPSVHTGQYRCLINNTLYSPPLVILSEPANLSLASKQSSSSLSLFFCFVLYFVDH